MQVCSRANVPLYVRKIYLMKEIQSELCSLITIYIILTLNRILYVHTSLCACMRVFKGIIKYY